jgi:hypothetical protein
MKDPVPAAKNQPEKTTVKNNLNQSQTKPPVKSLEKSAEKPIEKPTAVSRIIPTPKENPSKGEFVRDSMKIEPSPPPSPRSPGVTRPIKRIEKKPSDRQAADHVNNAIAITGDVLTLLFNSLHNIFLSY